MTATVPELIAAHAGEAPERPALVTWDGRERAIVTYAKLGEVSKKIAAGPAAVGLRAGDRLGVCLAKSRAGALYRLLYGAYRSQCVPAR